MPPVLPLPPLKDGEAEQRKVEIPSAIGKNVGFKISTPLTAGKPADVPRYISCNFFSD
jgi:hypothetical protein